MKKSNTPQNHPYLTMALWIIALFLLVAFSLSMIVPRSEPSAPTLSPTPEVQETVNAYPWPTETPDAEKTDGYDDSGEYEEDGLLYSYKDGTLTITAAENPCGTPVRGYGWKQSALNGQELLNSQIKTVRIGEGVIHLSKTAFANCNELTEVYLPSTLTSIDDFCFSNCQKLSAVYLPTNDCTWSVYAFDNCPNLNRYIGEDAYDQKPTPEPSEEPAESDTPGMTDSPITITPVAPTSTPAPGLTLIEAYEQYISGPQETPEVEPSDLPLATDAPVESPDITPAESPAAATTELPEAPVDVLEAPSQTDAPSAE